MLVVYHTHDTDVWNRHNVHKMFINIYRNLKAQNWFRYETFIHLFEFKGFSTWGKRGKIFLCWLFHLHPPPTNTCGTQPQTTGLTSPESQRSFSKAKTQFTAFSQISAQASGTWRHPHPLVPKCYLGFLFWHLWMTHPLRTRVSTCVNVAPN